jgi:hypothetical protein
MHIISHRSLLAPSQVPTSGQSLRCCCQPISVQVQGHCPLGVLSRPSDSVRSSNHPQQLRIHDAHAEHVWWAARPPHTSTRAQTLDRTLTHSLARKQGSTCAVTHIRCHTSRTHRRAPPPPHAHTCTRSIHAGGVNQRCIAANGPAECATPQQNYAHVETPFFVMNSMLDQYQMSEILQVGCNFPKCNASQIKEMVAYVNPSAIVCFFVSLFVWLVGWLVVWLVGWFGWCLACAFFPTLPPSHRPLVEDEGIHSRL